jgi:tetratricopeptide (TPR) repeat protein
MGTSQKMPDKPAPDTAAGPVLSPPQGSSPQGHIEAGNYLWLWISLAAVLAVGLAVIFALPALVQSPQPVEVAADPVVMPTGDARDAANQAMQAYLQLRAQLELGHASRWGEPEWSQSERAADSAARRLAQRHFSEAAGAYQQALQGLQRLDSERGTRLTAALDAAHQALADNRIEQAIEQFERALAIEEDNNDARSGLARSHTRAAVLQNMTTGEHAEAEGDLVAAQAAYQQAASLDPEYGPPAAAFNRVTDTLQMHAFQDAMTRALTALDSGRLSEAEKALAEASTLRPSDAAVTDARQRLAQARQQARLNHLRQQATSQLHTENWQAAADLYSKALDIDATAGFARSGLEKANARLEIHRQFDHYLTQPERLYAAQPLANAETLLAAISSAPASEPKLAKKIAELQRLVTLAGTPVAVNLLSDGETDISIYHVGQLGAFTRLLLELLPGTYTVVGSRVGYRDIRKQLSVTPGKQGISLTIRCEEMI